MAMTRFVQRSSVNGPLAAVGAVQSHPVTMDVSESMSEDVWAAQKSARQMESSSPPLTARGQQQRITTLEVELAKARKAIEETAQALQV